MMFKTTVATQSLSEQRRFKAFRVTPELMLQALGFRRDGEISYGIRVEGLPPEYELGGVMYDAMDNTFVFRVYHDSFPSVPEGGHVEFITITCYSIRLEGIDDAIASERERCARIVESTYAPWTDREAMAKAIRGEASEAAHANAH